MEVRLIRAQRRNQILDLLQQQGNVCVAHLSELLGVSDVTIRRDLGLLEQEGLLERTHGGAVLSQRMRVEPLFTVKYTTHLEEKRKIGAAAALVDPGQTIFINSGSTTLQIFREKREKAVLCEAASALAVSPTLEGYRQHLVDLLNFYLQQQSFRTKTQLGADLVREAVRWSLPFDSGGVSGDTGIFPS